MKKLYLTLLSLVLSVYGFSQVTVFTPNNSGGFENGGSFALNNWTSVNGPANQWAVGNGSVNVGTRGAYIGNGTTFVGSNTAAINHFYRTGGSVIAANATSVMLAFRYRQPVVDPGNDLFIVSVGDNATAPVPVAGSMPAAAYTAIYTNSASVLPGYVQIGPIDLSAYAGTTIRLVFTYVNNGVAPIGIPAVDSISLNYCAEITSTPATSAICPGGTLNFTCANSATGTWSSSNTAIASLSGTTAAAATITGGSAGTATITHTGGSCVVTRVVTVNPNPAPFTGSMSVCVGNTTSLSSTPAGGTWLSAATTIATIGGTSGIVSGIAPGTSNITYTLPTSCRRITPVTVNALPAVANVSGGGSRCATGPGLPVSLDASTPGTNYFLSDGTSTVATTTGTGAAFTFPGLFTTPGTYTVSATNPATTCSNNMAGSAVISITAPVVPAVTISASASLICSGNSVTFTANPVNGGSTPTYQWNVNGIPGGTASIFSYSPSNGDILDVTLTAGGICAIPTTATASQTMAVTPLSTPAVSISVGPSNPSCQGSPVTFTATPVFGGTVPIYLWTKNGINVATGLTYSCVPTNGDVVYCQMTSTFLCRAFDNVLSSPITMATMPSAALPIVSILAVPGTNVPAGTPVSLTAIVTGTSVPVAYQWLVNGTPIPGATASALTSNTFVSGDIVTCQVTNMDPCAKFTLKSVSFGSGTSGIANAPKDAVSFTLMPNPNKGTFTIQSSAPITETVTIKVTNLVGQSIYSTIATPQNGILNAPVTLGNIPAGMYILNINSASGSQLLHFVVAQ